ncbi:MAG: polymer-forming cytoskeletal protein [Deltaproteobacteria bacterium]|nr:polymer-forming cytoskeletal protein [Deltaproteobacteria bacterium]MBW2619921.1 polymer-forming cytoskeletal protein [Deltaproteobacteria bacterium]
MVKNESKDFSIIDRELTVDGTVSTSGRLIVKGVVKGTLVGENVVIAEEGAVYADAKVASITIGGTFEGEIRASKKLIILSTGSCKGKIVCKDFVVEGGGILNAQVTCIAATDADPEKYLLASGKHGA